MAITVDLVNLVGDWIGSNQLWMIPGEPAHESQSEMTISQGTRGGFTTLRYIWAEGGEAQEGILIIGPLTDPNAIQAEWIDTFHTMGAFMPFTGAVEADGTLIFKGTYSLPDGPEWGWQIRIPPPAGDQFQFIMYNVSPEGEEYLAVEAKYSRR